MEGDGPGPRGPSGGQSCPRTEPFGRFLNRLLPIWVETDYTVAHYASCPYRLEEPVGGTALCRQSLLIRETEGYQRPPRALR